MLHSSFACLTLQCRVVAQFTDIDQNGGGDAGDEFNNCPAFSADGSYSCNDEGSMPSGASWHLRFDDEVGGFTSHATCCKQYVAKPPTPVAGSSVNMGCVVVKDAGGSAGQTATATCPSGYELTGGGFHDIDRWA